MGRDNCKVLGTCWEIEYGSCDSLSSVDLEARFKCFYVLMLLSK